MSSYVPQVGDRVIVKPSWSSVLLSGEILAEVNPEFVLPPGDKLYKVGYDDNEALDIRDGWDYFDGDSIRPEYWFTITIMHADDPENDSTREGVRYAGAEADADKLLSIVDDLYRSQQLLRPDGLPGDDLQTAVGRLQAENARLQAALKPFADLWTGFENEPIPGENDEWSTCGQGDFLRWLEACAQFDIGRLCYSAWIALQTRPEAPETGAAPVTPQSASASAGEAADAAETGAISES